MTRGFGIIGTGSVANVHAKAIIASKQAELIGVYSRKPENVRDFAKEYQCRGFASLEEMGQSIDVEFVCICTPSGTHLEPALAMAKAKKHLIVEKPLEITLERCDRIIQAAEDAGILLSGIFQSRFHMAMMQLKNAVDKGYFGNISLCCADIKWFRNQQYYDSDFWRGTWHLDGGGALMNQAIHSVDLLLWLMGPVADVRAFADTLTHSNIEVEDNLTGIIRFERGCLGTLCASTSAWPGSSKRVEICGDKGHAVVEEDHITCWDFQDNVPIVSKQESANTGGANNPSDLDYSAHQKQLEDCISAFGEGRPPMVDGQEARHAVETVLRFYEAAGLPL